MEARAIQRLGMSILVSPLILTSYVLEIFRIAWFIERLGKCTSAAQEAMLLPENYLLALNLAEDHRNDIHPGVDPIGIIRSVFVFLLKRNIQGASTIEQQFVRVVTNSYERTLTRKLREQLIAIALVRKIPKNIIASAYLHRAYFGDSCIGILAFSKKHTKQQDDWNIAFIIKAVARLKYPEPATQSAVWLSKVSLRESYVEKKVMAAANKQFNHGQTATQFAH